MSSDVKHDDRHYFSGLNHVSPAAEEFGSLIHGLSFKDVWEQRFRLIDLVIEHADGFLDLQWILFKQEFKNQVSFLPERSHYFSEVGSHLQFLFAFLITPIAYYSMSLSRDFQNRWRGEQYGCNSMAFFDEHSSIFPKMGEDILLTHALVAVMGYFRRVIAVYMYKFMHNEYRSLVGAHKFAPNEDLISGHFMERWIFIDKRSDYRILRSIIEAVINDLSNCCLYVQALDEINLFPYLIYETGEYCSRHSDHVLRNNVILPVIDPRWEVMFPGSRRQCDCRILQLNEQERQEFSGGKEIKQEDYRRWSRYFSHKEFDPDTRLPYPSIIY